MSATKAAAFLLLLVAADAIAQDYNVPFRRRTISAPAWSSVGTFATSTDTTSDTTHTITTSAQLDSGNLGVCVLAKDESGVGTTNGNGNAQFTSLTDSAGNTWIEAYEWCNMRTATAADGACVGVYYTKATANLAAAATLTPTYTTAKSKASTCWEFSAPSLASVAMAAGENGLANNAADPGSMTIATTVNREHLFLRLTACETSTTTYTADADYNGLTNATASTGTQATSMAVRGEYRISTEATSAASDPTLGARDCASAMIALDAS